MSELELDHAAHIQSVILDVCGALGIVIDGVCTVFLLNEFRYPKSPLRSSYFVILVIGLVVTILSLAMRFQFVFDPRSLETDWRAVTVSIIQWFSQNSLGIWIFILGLNRCTAIMSPRLHTKIWSPLPTSCFIISLFVFPLLLNGYYWSNQRCRFVLWATDEDCVEFQFKNNLITSIANIVIGIITFFFIIFAVFYSREQYGAFSSKNAKIERRLILQTFVSSIFLILLYVTLVVSTKVMTDQKTLIVVQVLANLFFFLHHYPGIIILFCVSPTFRDRFMSFYRITAVLKFLKIGKSADGKTSGKINVY
ncbi:hypothetical protein FO519_007615 [Halicephalobus sp. NKZ332]|nr:hypothetical protein FO519_007615 [Halicephalobus sp. NKZ332]